MKQNPFCMISIKKTVSSLTTYLVIILVIFLTSFNVFANWQIGYHQFHIGQASGDLEVNMNKWGGLTSASFLTQVGGLAFESIAVPEKNLVGKTIELHYDKHQRDDKRFSINIIDSKTCSPFLPNWDIFIFFDDCSTEIGTYHLFLPDWQLVPIARYANSKFDAIVSLFGKNMTKNQYDIVYHPAFKDTLLGLRLLQMDILLMDMSSSSFQKLPKFNNKTILGRGELNHVQASLNEQKRTARREIKRVIDETTYRSWVFTDSGIEVKFNIQGSKLKLTGYPYHYFWKFQWATKTVVPRNELIRKMQEKQDLLKTLNPIVYNATVNTMHFAAFFRHVKLNNNNGWKKFIQQLESVKIEPVIKTPTSWARR